MTAQAVEAPEAGATAQAAAAQECAALVSPQAQDETAMEALRRRVARLGGELPAGWSLRGGGRRRLYVAPNGTRHRSLLSACRELGLVKGAGALGGLGLRGLGLWDLTGESWACVVRGANVRDPEVLLVIKGS